MSIVEQSDHVYVHINKQHSAAQHIHSFTKQRQAAASSYNRTVMEPSY